MWNPFRSEVRLDATLARLREKSPAPVFWLVGKTQSGKSSIIRYLTGATDAVIGEGFKPCTRHSRIFAFPNEEAPLLTFLDTRGLEEAGYDPLEDLAAFGKKAQACIVTLKLLDQATEGLEKHWKTIRRANSRRPMLLAITCLHEAYPQQQHPEPYPYGGESQAGIPPEVIRPLQSQLHRLAPLYDRAVPIDLTRPEEGFTEPNYGGTALKNGLIELLPHAYRSAFMSLETTQKELSDAHLQAAMPHILGYASMAATAGAVPVPLLDLFIIPSIQARMIFKLARLYRQPLSAQHFMELAGSLGMGIAVRQASREVLKLIPYVGSVASAAVAAASTYALGRAFCFYYERVKDGTTPSADELRSLYKEQLQQAEGWWRGVHK